jgi:hypothetical protein
MNFLQGESGHIDTGCNSAAEAKDSTQVPKKIEPGDAFGRRLAVPSFLHAPCAARRAPRLAGGIHARF